MKKSRGKIISILLLTLSIVSIGIGSYAHSGRTDSSGGHRDNKNKSGLGSYHYHCGGYPAHLHKNGICPYSSSKSNSSSSSTSTNSSSKTNSTSSTTTTKTATVLATGIQINEAITSMEVGESKKITARIKPNNTTNRNITWKSSDESIASISSEGKITAKKSGTVTITATTSNGKTSTTKINIKEEPKLEESNAIKTSTIKQNSITNSNTNNNDSEDSNALGGIVALGLLGGIGYWGYKKYKK